MIGKVTVNEILIRIQAAAREHNINLTYTNMKVYLKLLDYAKEYKDKVEIDFHGMRFDVTTHELARYCLVAPRTVTESLHKLKDCDVIKYTTKRPDPSTVKLYKEYYE